MLKVFISRKNKRVYLTISCITISFAFFIPLIFLNTINNAFLDLIQPEAMNMRDVFVIMTLFVSVSAFLFSSKAVAPELKPHYLRHRKVTKGIFEFSICLVS